MSWQIHNVRSNFHTITIGYPAFYKNDYNYWMLYVIMERDGEQCSVSALAQNNYQSSTDSSGKTLNTINLQIYLIGTNEPYRTKKST